MKNSQSVILELASPEEIASGGKGWTIRAGFADTAFGNCLIGECPRGICCVSFVDSADGAAAMTALQSRWPLAHLQRDDANAMRIASLIFRPPEKSPVLHAYVQGTPFQLQVWRALLEVPRGALISYGQLAAVIGKPAAVRAVGTAVGQNSVSVLIPCHRVILGSGKIGNYHWGVERKRALIASERPQAIDRGA
jgi:AraC family transcriptional regulator, regulatory protein of adaptative response / methylated-DNA-[protein]-cysteine methyltransferase